MHQMNITVTVMYVHQFTIKVLMLTVHMKMSIDMVVVFKDHLLFLLSSTLLIRDYFIVIIIVIYFIRTENNRTRPSIAE